MSILQFLVLMLVSPAFFAMDKDEQNDNGNSSSEIDEANAKKSDATDAALNSDIFGLTVGEAKSFLLDQGKHHHWREGSVCCTSWAIAGSSYAIGIVGSVLAGLWCANYSWIVQCKSHCNLGYSGDGWCTPSDSCYETFAGCAQACGSNNTATPHDAICISGAVMVPTPIILTALAAFSGCLTRLGNKRLDRLNKDLEFNTNNRFVRGRADADVLSIDDMEYLGALLMAAGSPLLAKLSAAQALVLAKINKHLFRQCADSLFSGNAKIASQKLLRMLEMDASTLGSTLADRNVRKVLKDERALFQTLIQTLSKRILDDDKVRKGIKKILKTTTNSKNDDDGFWEEAIDQIASGISLDAHFLKTVVVEGSSIFLRASDGEVSVRKEELRSVSNTIDLLISDFESQTEFDFKPPVTAQWLSLLKRVAHKEPLGINHENIIDILDAANFFTMKSVLEQCDQFLLVNGIKKLHLANWRQRHGKESTDKTPLLKHWRFCEQYNLLANKNLLARKVAGNLSLITGKEADAPLLRELKLLNLTYFTDGDSLQNLTAFKGKLANPQFLAWAWHNGKAVEIVRVAVVQFCKAPENKMVVDSAWVAIPKDLKAAIEKDG